MEAVIVVKKKKRNELIQEMFWRGKRLGCLSDTWHACDDSDDYKKMLGWSRWYVLGRCGAQNSTDDGFQLDVLNSVSLKNRLALSWGFKIGCNSIIGLLSKRIFSFLQSAMMTYSRADTLQLPKPWEKPRTLRNCANFISRCSGR